MLQRKFDFTCPLGKNSCSQDSHLPAAKNLIRVLRYQSLTSARSPVPQLEIGPETESPNGLGRMDYPAWRIDTKWTTPLILEFLALRDFRDTHCRQLDPIGEVEWNCR
jgi:hypothetical protein